GPKPSSCAIVSPLWHNAEVANRPRAGNLRGGTCRPIHEPQNHGVRGWDRDGAPHETSRHGARWAHYQYIVSTKGEVARSLWEQTGGHRKAGVNVGSGTHTNAGG